MFKKSGLMLLLMLSAGYTHAAAYDCGFAPLQALYIAGDRSDGPAQSNKLYLVLADTLSCSPGSGIIKYAYIRNDAPSYNTMLSLASMAFATGASVRVLINDATIEDGINDDGSVTTDVNLKAAEIEGLGFK